jgi:DNA-binding transcriptional LysR family regulator
MANFKQFQCAIALADYGHFGEAANHVGITTSGLTQSIHRLEEYYGESLFIRTRNGTTLTPYGEVVVEGARSVIERATAITRQVQLISNMEVGHLIIGSDPLLTSPILAPAIAALLRLYPSFKFSVRTGSWEKLSDLLEQREIDLFVGFPPLEQQTDSFQIQNFTAPSPIVVCAPDHPLKDKPARKLGDYLQYPLLAAPLPDWYLRWASRQLEDEENIDDFTDNYYLNTDDIGILKRIAINSHAIVGLMRSEVSSDIEAGDLIELRPQNWPMTVPVAIAFLKDRPTTTAAEKLLSELHRQLAILSETEFAT